MYFKCLFVKRTYFIVITFIFIPSREEAHLFSPYKKFTHYVFLSIFRFENIYHILENVFMRKIRKSTLKLLIQILVYFQDFLCVIFGRIGVDFFAKFPIFLQTVPDSHFQQHLRSLFCVVQV